MHRLNIYQLLFCINFFVIVGFTTISTGQTRIIAFAPGSTFFYRMNYKINSVPYTKLFAQASGYKVAWKLPDGTGLRNRRSVRELHESAELLYERHGLDGKSCVTNDLCRIEKYVRSRTGVVAKILKLLLRSLTENETSIVEPLICQRNANSCPLYLIGFNDFTEH